MLIAGSLSVSNCKELQILLHSSGYFSSKNGKSLASPLLSLFCSSKEATTSNSLDLNFLSASNSLIASSISAIILLALAIMASGVSMPSFTQSVINKDMNAGSVFLPLILGSIIVVVKLDKRQQLRILRLISHALSPTKSQVSKL